MCLLFEVIYIYKKVNNTSTIRCNTYTTNGRKSHDIILVYFIEIPINLFLFLIINCILQCLLKKCVSNRFLKKLKYIKYWTVGCKHFLI